nr:hypothetical protein [Legionella tunisiensis]
MALADSASTAAARFANLSVPRQLGLMLGLAASVAIGVGVVLWSREPTYLPLYSEIGPRDATDIVDLLQRNNIPFKIDKSHGTILVQADEAQEARLKVAAEGLPRGKGAGYESFSTNSNVLIVANLWKMLGINKRLRQS